MAAARSYIFRISGCLYIFRIFVFPFLHTHNLSREFLSDWQMIDVISVFFNSWSLTLSWGWRNEWRNQNLFLYYCPLSKQITPVQDQFIIRWQIEKLYTSVLRLICLIILKIAQKIDYLKFKSFVSTEYLDIFRRETRIYVCNNYVFNIKSILKSLVILAIWLALSGAIYSQIALFLL